MVAAQLTIDSIAAGGDGIGRSGGLAVFVPRTAPGDVVEASLDVRGRFARGRLRTIIEPSHDRVEPVCRHYTRDRCGGCQLQHLGYTAQLSAKSTIVRDAMQRIAKRADVRHVEVVPSPSQWGYRTKLTLALRWTGERWRAGLHPFDNPEEVFQLEECPITDDRVLSVWREIFAASTLLPRVRRLRGAVRLTDDGASFVLEGAAAWPNAAAFADRVGSLTSIWWQSDEGQKRLVVDRRAPRHVAGATAPDASFVQVNAATSELLRQHVISRTMAMSPATVVDAYAGAGATAVGLAERGARVTAIELDAAAARWTGAHLPAGSRAVVGRVEDEIERALPADVVILNPPRTGVDVRVTASLEANRPRAIVYVSCNPATLARDVSRLSGFRVTSLLSFDMFPQTAHVETVCELVPEAA
jgi:23S rRNA (uracil1939-C5)-methyltransferase